MRERRLGCRLIVHERAAGAHGERWRRDPQKQTESGRYTEVGEAWIQAALNLRLERVALEPNAPLEQLPIGERVRDLHHARLIQLVGLRSVSVNRGVARQRPRVGQAVANRRGELRRKLVICSNQNGVLADIAAGRCADEHRARLSIVGVPVKQARGKPRGNRRRAFRCGQRGERAIRVAAPRHDPSIEKERPHESPEIARRQIDQIGIGHERREGTLLSAVLAQSLVVAKKEVPS
jgi:hypothetical protein